MNQTVKTESLEVCKLSYGRDARELCHRLAEIHTECAPDDLLTRLGTGFLANLFYPWLIKNDSSIVYGIKDGEVLTSFVAATIGSHSSLKSIFMHQPVLSMWYGFSRVALKPSVWNTLSEALLIKTPKTTLPYSEIMMIASAIKCRGRGYGAKLLSTLDSELKKLGIRTSLARVRDDNVIALKMYDKYGYKEIGSIVFNGVKWRWLTLDLV